MFQRLHPMPLAPEPFNADLDLKVLIETSTGWVDLSDGVRFDIEASSFGDSTVSWRKQETSNTWVEGSYVSSAVREDVTEVLSVWVYGESRLEHEQLKRLLTDALGQLQYRIMVRMDEAVTYWQCEPADYTITSGHEMRHARLALVKASISRKPDADVFAASLDEM